MSYDSPAPEVEEPTTEPDSSPDPGTGVADPAGVDPESGTDDSGTPVDNPAG